MTDNEASTRAALDALSARVTRLEDERAILDTMHRYGQAVDNGDDRIWADLFTPDGAFSATDRDGNELLRSQGREALAEWVRNFRARETKVSRHIVLAPVIEVHGDTATVRSYLTRLIENEDPYLSPVVLVMGRYHDELVKDAQGQWRFRTRTARTDAPLIKRPA